MTTEAGAIEIGAVHTGNDDFPVWINVKIPPPADFWGRVKEAWAVLLGKHTVHQIYLNHEQATSLGVVINHVSH